MTDDEIFNRTVKILREELLLEASQDIQLSTRLAEDFAMDSLDVVELAMALEQEFDVELPDEDMERAKTVQDVITMLRQHDLK